MRYLEPGFGGERLGLIVEHHEHALAPGSFGMDVIEHLRVAEQAVADVLHRVELAMRAVLGHKHTWMSALEGVKPGDVVEGLHPPIDAEQIERGR